MQRKKRWAILQYLFFSNLKTYYRRCSSFFCVPLFDTNPLRTNLTTRVVLRRRLEILNCIPRSQGELSLPKRDLSSPWVGGPVSPHMHFYFFNSRTCCILSVYCENRAKCIVCLLFFYCLAACYCKRRVGQCCVFATKVHSLPPNQPGLTKWRIDDDV